MKNEEIGKRIKQQRKALNISVVDVAEYTGLSKATIHRYESGEIKNIKLPVLETIANILNVNPAWLIGKSENMERVNDKSTNILFEIDRAINLVKGPNYLTVGTRQITDRERYMIAKILQLAKDILDKGD